MSKSGTEMQFTYNSDGIRTSKTVNGVKASYHVVGGQIQYMQTGDQVVRFNYSGSSVLSIEFEGQEYWYIRNMQNDIIGLLNKTGQMVVEYSYDSWGQPIAVTGSMAESLGKVNPFRYRGYIFDEESGLYYLQSRYYTPIVGRFIHADAVAGASGDILSYNVFAYCSNDPINRRDPSGMYFDDARWGSGMQQNKTSSADTWGSGKGAGNIKQAQKQHADRVNNWGVRDTSVKYSNNSVLAAQKTSESSSNSEPNGASQGLSLVSTITSYWKGTTLAFMGCCSDLNMQGNLAMSGMATFP